MNIKLIGKNIRQAREIVGISQKELANRLGISWEMISRYENGRSNPLNHITEIALILSQELGFFFELPERANTTNQKNIVPFYYEIADINEKLLVDYDTTYSIANWASNKYTKLFALKLNKIDSKVLNFSKNDIGIFCLDVEVKFDYYLLNSEILYKPHTFNITKAAGLVYIEKRFV